MKLRDATLQVTKKTVSHILLPHSHTLTLLPSFPQNASPLFLPKRLWKCASIISFRKYNRKLVLPVIYLFHYDSSKSTFFMLNMTLTFSWVQFCQINENSLFLGIERLQKHPSFWVHGKTTYKCHTVRYECIRVTDGW